MALASFIGSFTGFIGISGGFLRFFIFLWVYLVFCGLWRSLAVFAGLADFAVWVGFLWFDGLGLPFTVFYCFLRAS